MALLKKLEEAGFLLPRSDACDESASQTTQMDSERRVVLMSPNPLDEIWKIPQRPPLPSSEVYVHSEIFAGGQAQDKGGGRVELCLDVFFTKRISIRAVCVMFRAERKGKGIGNGGSDGEGKLQFVAAFSKFFFSGYFPTEPLQ